MDFGINLATSADSFKVVKRAEALGYSRAWFYDTQMLNADVFVAMGAAAVQTSKIRLATGVLILAGAGFQAAGFQQLPSSHLYHSVAALNRTGQGFAARMIAAEALARTVTDGA